jgi:hypothetical protein
MMSSMILNAILCLGVTIMVVSPLAWAIRTARRDHPAAVAKARLERGVASAHRAPQSGGIRRGQAWSTS